MRHILLTVFGLVMLLPVTAQNGLFGLTPIVITGTSNLVSQKQTFIADTNTNSIWIGYRYAGAACYRNNAWTIYDTANSGIPGNWVNAIAPNGVTSWFGTSAGLGRLINNNWVTFNTSNSGLVSDNILSLCTAGSALWAGTNKGLHYFDGNSNWTVYDTAGSPLPSDNINCIDRDANGQLYIGTSGGFCVFNPATQNWTIYNVQNSVLDNNLVYAVYCRGPGDVWLATNTEVFHLSGNVLSAFSELYETRAVGKPSGVRNFCTDNNGNLVFMSNLGVITISNRPVPDVRKMYYFGSSGFFATYMPDSACFFMSSGFMNNTPIFGTMKRYDPAGYRPFILGNEATYANVRFLDLNEVSTPIPNRGDLFTNGLYSGLNETPKGSGKGTIFNAGLWLGGLDQGGNLHQAAMTYRQRGSDFWPGPLDTVSLAVDSATAQQYDYVWKIERTKLNDFQYHFAQGNVQNGSYIPDYDIITWPAHGNTLQNQARNLAPFVDVNGNGIYDPLTGGDYPEMSGDQMLYCIYNDVFAPHGETGGLPLGVEIHSTVYAYLCPNIADSNRVLNHTIFCRYKIINRSAFSYSNCYVGMFYDFDLGDFFDDYIGSYPPANMLYAYNGDLNDGPQPYPVTGTYGANPPTQAAVFLDGPVAEANDGIDNDNDGTTDEPGEVNLLTHFMYHNNDFTVTGNPDEVTDYYGYLKAQWKDSTNMTYGGNGYGGTTDTSFMYPDLPFTAGWNEGNISNMPHDRRGIGSAGPFNLNAGQKTTFEFAMVYSRDTTLAQNNPLTYTHMVNDVNKVRSWYANNNAPSCMPWNVGIAEPQQTASLQLFPNPASEEINLVYGNAEANASYVVWNMQGQLLLQGKLAAGGKTTLAVNELPPGMYFIQLPEKGISSRFIRN